MIGMSTAHGIVDVSASRQIACHYAKQLDPRYAKCKEHGPKCATVIARSMLMLNDTGITFGCKFKSPKIHGAE
jgi:predicted carbohydrate-binding protein with CBM5 and CBM33 domain